MHDLIHMLRDIDFYLLAYACSTSPAEQFIVAPLQNFTPALQKSMPDKYISNTLMNLATNASRWKMTLDPSRMRCS